jgi:membrane protease YdiL (CAAX protease family)
MKAMEILEYLRQPIFIENRNLTKIKDKVKGVIITYFIYLLPVFCSVLLLFILDKFIFGHFYNYSILEKLYSNQQELKSIYGAYTFLIVVLVGPFLEEIIFRLPLTLEKSAIALSIALLTYRFTGGHFYEFNFSEGYSYVRLGIAIFTLLMIIKFLPPAGILAFKLKYFKYLFYGSALVFALMNIKNFTPLNDQVFLFYPLYTLPQLVMGLFIGYNRMKYGFISGWGLHALINLPFALLG